MYGRFDYTKITQLLKDTVLLRCFEETKKPTSSIIFIPDRVNDRVTTLQAEVLAMGSKFRYKDDVKVGDIVLVPSQFGTMLNVDEPDVKIFDGEDIHAIVTEHTT